MFQQTERAYVKKEGAPVSVRPCALNSNQSMGTELQNSGVAVSKRCVLSTLTWNDRQVLSLEAVCVFEIAVSHKHQQRLFATFFFFLSLSHWLVGSFPSGFVASHTFHCCITPVFLATCFKYCSPGLPTAFFPNIAPSSMFTTTRYA